MKPSCCKTFLKSNNVRKKALFANIGSQNDERSENDITVSIAVQKLGLEWSNCRDELKECDSAGPIAQRENVAIENVDTWPAVEWKPKNITTLIRHPFLLYITRR